MEPTTMQPDFTLDEYLRFRKKWGGHICPPSSATHPRNRWDMYYVYMFINKFTGLKDDIPGFLTVEDLEDALLDEAGKVNILLEQVVLRFILNLRPNTRNTSSELIPTTLSSLLHEFPRDKERLRERTIFWDEELESNFNPLKDVEGGFWFATWDLKLRILRQLVDWQLVYSSSIRDIIDTAWQSKQKPHKKKAEAPKPAPNPGDPGSRDSLSVTPLGQDRNRTRFWIADKSPRLYTSTNPWKVTQQFQCVSTNRDEYIDWIDKLREAAPPEQEDQKYMDMKHFFHWELIYALELRVDAIDEEAKRIDQVRKRLVADAGRNTATATVEARTSLRRTRLRGRPSGDSDNEGSERAVHVNGVDKSRASGSGRSNSIPDAELVQEENNSDIDDQNGRSFVFTPAELWLLQRGGDDVEEIDELQDDSSLLNESNDEDSTRNGKKRRRRPSPPDRKPTRVSARKRQRREEPEVTKVNGDIPRKSNGHTAGLEPTLARLKGSKGQNTKFWYYEEGDSAPSKRPEMLDDPEKMIKRSRKSEKTPDADTLLREAKNPLENEPGKNGDLTMEPVP